MSNGPAATALFYFPSALALDGNGNLFVADTYNNAIRKISSDGEVTIFAGQAASFKRPLGLSFDRSGHLLVADQGNHRIRRLTPEGNDSWILGIGSPGSGDNQSGPARFNEPSAAVEAPDGSILVVDTANALIRRITVSNLWINNLAGGLGQHGNVDGVGSSARFNRPRGMVITTQGRILVADYGNRSIREITLAGEVRTIAGSTNQYDSRVGIGSAALFRGPDSLAADASGRIVITDSPSELVRQATFVPAPFPRLDLSQQGTDLIFSWPADLGNFRLEARSDLLSPTAWEPVAGDAGPVGGRMVRTNGMVGPTRFFRLRSN